jgi:hypothetical protein
MAGVLSDHDQHPVYSNNIDPGIVIYFPDLTKGNNEDDDRTWEEVCLLAAETHRPIHLTDHIKSSDCIISLRRHQHLMIRGLEKQRRRRYLECNDKRYNSNESNHSNNNKELTVYSITGNLHSLFLLNNSSRLTLEYVDLYHLLSSSSSSLSSSSSCSEHQQQQQQDCRQVGAAINLRYKSTAVLHNCKIFSQGGFCGWAVQKATLDLDHCTLRAPIRSALVCFGQATLHVKSCTIEKAGVHGICARGKCTVHIQDSTIIDSTIRGLYAYAHANVWLERTIISGTVRPDMAAIEICNNGDCSATTNTHNCSTTKVFLTPNKDQVKSKPNISSRNESFQCSRLTMKYCHVMNNAGVGVKIRGDVVLHNNLMDESMGNCFEGNNYFCSD